MLNSTDYSDWTPALFLGQRFKASRAPHLSRTPAVLKLRGASQAWVRLEQPIPLEGQTVADITLRASKHPDTAPSKEELKQTPLPPRIGVESQPMRAQRLTQFA